MPRISKSPWLKKRSSISPELSGKVEGYLNSLLAVSESDPFDSEVFNNLIQNMDEDPVLADLFLKKLLDHEGLRALRLLFDLHNYATSKSVRKSIKRALYYLKQRGMDIPFPAPNRPEKEDRGILRETGSTQVMGYLSEFDVARNLMLVLLIPQVPKGKVFVFALIDPEGTLESITALEVSKKGAKGILEELEGQVGHSFLAADPKQVAFVLKEAHDRKSNLSKEDERIYAGIIHLLEGSGNVGQSPIIRSLFPIDELFQEVPSSFNRLTRIAEVSYYSPKAEVFEPYRNAIQDAQEGVLIISQAQKREQVQEIVRRAAREIFQGREREGLIRYLEELAYLYYLKDQLEESKVLFSAAHFLNKERDQAIARENPLLIWLVEKALLSEKIRDTDGTQSPIPEKSRGGIIIPSWVK